VTKRDQVDAVAHAAGITPRQARDAIDALASVVGVALRNDERIKVDGLGTFVVQHRRPRRVRNPATGIMMDVPASAVVKFKPVLELRSSVDRMCA
jgi:DNA-binding protein HU-beta